ncbi:hypothetical protein EJ06DRAFT_534096 [Trichodelitschia bisporula]|uniref:Uncharacterized protein n=1 Tax=Trichodelitschia bisporula TaxID=703511 RepID=A0A6G1HKJ9_9PEZI|nr:hypothetical protein EJ06DRAFT_534096 [Trichodelitschia bisporula]
MDRPPVFFPASPGTPLFSLSPERVNGTRPPYSGPVNASPEFAKHDYGKSDFNNSAFNTPSFGKPDFKPEFGKPSLNAASTIDPFVITGSPSCVSALGSPIRGTSLLGSPNRGHSRSGSAASASDAHVQGMVARFDALSIRDWKASGELAIKRAEMAREMAELEREKLKTEVDALTEELRKVREEARRVKKELDEAREERRKGAKRIEVLGEELARSKETQSKATGMFEKEVKKCRKEAYKASTALVKTAEELKSVRSQLLVAQADLASEKQRCAKREQDAFTAQYRLVEVQEELERAWTQMKVLEEERNALKHTLHHEEVARIAAEGMIALPTIDEDDFLLSSPSKSPRKSPTKQHSRGNSDKENVVPLAGLELKLLEEDLALERRRRESAEDQIEFMKMECQFLVCSCRIAEGRGGRYVHDASLVEEMEHIKQTLPLPLPRAPKEEHRDEHEDTPMEDASPAAEEDDHLLINFTDAPEVQAPSRTQTSALADSQPQPIPTTTPAPIMHAEIIDIPLPASPTTSPETTPSPLSTPTLAPQTPSNVEIRTITTTTTIPITFSPHPSTLIQHAPNHAAPHTPSAGTPASPFPAPSTAGKAFKPDGTLDRAAALAQIQARRGRARSMALGTATPKSVREEGVGVDGRRDVSAPVLRVRSKSRTRGVVC